MEALLSKLVKGYKNQETFLKEIKDDISGQTQKIEYYATTIKQLEMQFGKISTMLNQRQLGKLLRNNVQNPNNNFYYIAINIQSGNSTVYPQLPIVDVLKNDSIVVYETPSMESDQAIVFDIISVDKCTSKVDEPVVKQST